MFQENLLMIFIILLLLFSKRKDFFLTVLPINVTFAVTYHKSQKIKKEKNTTDTALQLRKRKRRSQLVSAFLEKK